MSVFGTIITDMPTLRQQTVIKKMVENGGKSVSKAMVEAGYSKSMAKNPQKLTNSLGWSELIEKYLPIESTLKAHKGLLFAKSVKHYSFSKSMDDGDIRKIFNGSDSKVVKIINTKTSKIVYVLETDSNSVLHALDLTYRIRGSYKAIKLELEDPFSQMSDEELQQIIDTRKPLR